MYATVSFPPVLLRASDRIEIKWTKTYNKAGELIASTVPTIRLLPRNFWEWINGWLWRWLGHPDFRPQPINDTSKKAFEKYIDTHYSESGYWG